MAPKSADPTGTKVYIIWSPAVGIDSVHTTLDAATDVLSSDSSLSISIKELIGGTVVLSSSAEGGQQAAPKAAPKPAAKAKAKPKAIKKEEADDEDEDEDIKDEPEAATASAPAESKAKPTKTKTPAEQRALNATKPAKPSASSSDLPDNVKALLQKGGNVFEGQTVIVTGVPPTLGRKNAERLVEAFGAHLGKSLSKKTGWVVVGNDAGPKKLLQIEELGLKTLDEDELVKMLEGSGGNGVKREASDEDDEEEEDEEEENPKPLVKRVKK